MHDLPVVVLRPGKERPLKLGHPWIFSGGIAKEPRGIALGALVAVAGADGKPLALGTYSPHSQIRVRVLSTDIHSKIDAFFWQKRLQEAVARRAHIWQPGQTEAVRLVSAESDDLPGLIIDRYGDVVVMQILAAGMEANRTHIIEAIQHVIAPRCIVERSDDASRTKEGLEPRVEVVSGHLLDGPIKIILEDGLAFYVDVMKGHKTGCYLDQRQNRRFVGKQAKDLRVLNCFSYSGGFGVHCIKAGAKEIVHIDESQPALDLAKQNAELTPGFAQSSHQYIRGDVFSFLRKWVQDGERFDLVILDPPKFANSASQVDKSCRGYKDLALHAMKLLPVGGWLASFSCSGHISLDLFQKVTFGASVDAQCHMEIKNFLFQSDDHPIVLNFPESLYLKGLWLQKR